MSTERGLGVLKLPKKAYKQTINGVRMNSIVSLIRLIKFIQVLSLFDIEKDSLFSCMTYYFLISHFISFNERHVFNAKACLLLMKKFLIIYC
jgi:hypothetical protein